MIASAMPVCEMVAMLARDIGVRDVVDLRKWRTEHTQKLSIRLVRDIVCASGLTDIKLTFEIADVAPHPSALAWVALPRPCPPRGSLAFKNWRFEMGILRSAHTAPFSTFVFAIAHESAHIILESAGHPLRLEERAVDVMAMLGGFSEYYVAGCQFTTNVEVFGWQLQGINKVGYLTEREVDEAHALIKELRKSNKR